MVDNFMQQMMDELNNTATSAGSQGMKSFKNSVSQNVSDSLCTRDRNIRDALENMKALQDLTISSGLMKHTQIQDEGEGSKPALVDEVVLHKLKDIELKQLLDKRFTELNSNEKVVLTLHMINQQVTNIDSLIQKVCADAEQDFLNAYSGHMGMVMRELKNFKQKINANKLELKKNKQIKNLQAEVDYFQEEALNYRELDKQQQEHITQVQHQNEGLRDDAYVLRKALLNTKLKQRALEKQLEETQNNNLELVVQVQSLHTQMREQLINFQKQQLIQSALDENYVPQPIMSEQQQLHSLAQSEASGRIANIKFSDGLNAEDLGGAAATIQHGGAIVSANSSNLENGSTTLSNGFSSAVDEQGIRAFLTKLLNSRHLFSISDMVDQIEAFVQIKIDKCNQMIASFRDRLAKQEKETRRILIENKKLSTDQFNVQKVFKSCLEQIKNDKRGHEQRQVYQNPQLERRQSETAHTSLNSGGFHTQRRVAKRIQSAQARKASGAATTATSQTSRIGNNKLSARVPQPSKGIYVIKSKIGQQSQRERKETTARMQPIDDLDVVQSKEFANITTMTRHGRNSIANNNRAFQTLEQTTVPLVGPSPEHLMQATQVNSPTFASQNFASERDQLASEINSSSNARLTANDKRSIIESFMRDEHVFQLLYDTVFRSPKEATQAQEAATLKSNSMNQADVKGKELPRQYVRQVSNANEQLFKAVVSGSQTASLNNSHISGGHRRNQTMNVESNRGTGQFFTSEPLQPMLAIAENPDVMRDAENTERKNSATFFVTLQDAAKRQGDEKTSPKQMRTSRDQSITGTLRASQDVESAQVQLAGGEMRKSTEEVEHPSVEIEDEVNQLDFDEPDLVAPLAQAVSNGNLNVQTLIEQSKSLGRPGRPVRPQSSRPMFRQQFMTLDPSQKRLGGGVAAQSKEPLQNQAFSSTKDIQEQIEMQRQIGEQHFSSNMTLEAGQINQTQQRNPLPQPSLMMRDRSSFIHHMLELETKGRISQKAVNQKHLSPRSSRLLASRHFMNRNSTAGSSGFAGKNKRGSEGSSVMPQPQLRDPHREGTLIGKTRPMSSKIPKAPTTVTNKFKQHRQRLGSAKIRSNLHQRGGMFQATAPLAQQPLLNNADYDGQMVMGPAILSSNSSKTFFNATQK